MIAADISAIAIGQPATPPPIDYVRPRPGQLAPFTGRFQMPDNYYAPNATLEIQDRGEFLEATWSNGPVTVIYPSGGDDFVDRTNWAMVRFHRGADGQIDGFSYKLLEDFQARKLAPR